MGRKYIEAMLSRLSRPAITLVSKVFRASLNWPCEVCGAWQGQGLCADCLTRFAAQHPARCPRCALPSPGNQTCGACLRHPPPYEACITAVDYGFPWDRLIGRFKFEAQPELAGLLGQLLGHALSQHQASAPDWVIPMPLSPQRLAERGYNQAWELAKRVATPRAWPLLSDALQRLDTAHQVGSTRAERERNLRDALWVQPVARTQLRHAHVALVDDVVTTGVSAAAAAKALLSVGATSVQVWTVARTPAPDR
jgi:ComF family protein